MRTKTPHQADKILQAAGHLFGAQRFHEVRMEDIAAEAEVGKGTLYRYFNDKEELYLALVAQAGDQLLLRLHEDLYGVVGARAKLEATVAAFISFFDENPHLFDLIQRAEVMAGPSFPWKKARAESMNLVRQLFEEGQRNGEFEVEDPEVASLLLGGGVRSVIRFGKRPRPAGIERQIVDTLCATSMAKK
jgi:AcrR family transcriptional regulator